MKSLTAILLLSCVLYASAANYAVIVAGSNSFMNYRHQADVCHAYHVLIDDGGFAPENIILMSYDDVASDSENPFPNTLFNKPTTGAGVDVNKGCKIDYKGNDVTAANYLSILKGDAAAMKGIGSGKVLTSTKNDKVFLNFADHGGAGLIAFPVGDYLYAQDLLDALAYMTQKNMYKELVYYLEACESGSMFTSLPTNTKIYGVSAANPSESSWGTYCPPDDVVNGKEIGSCLGDTFSINWMEDSDTNAKLFSTRSLQDQFATVKKLTTQSEVMQWGDLTFTSEPIGNFLGAKGNGKEDNLFNKFVKNVKGSFRHFKEEKQIVGATQIDSRDIAVQYLLNKFKKNPTTANQKALIAEIKSMKYFDDVFNKIKSSQKLSGYIATTTNFDCYKKAIKNFSTQCEQPTAYAQKYFRYLYEMCQSVTGLGYEGIFNTIGAACN